LPFFRCAGVNSNDTLECGALTPLSFFSFFFSLGNLDRKIEKKESGVKAPHSKYPSSPLFLFFPHNRQIRTFRQD
jgi:hypothetical protein